ncbi:superoxide dismutase [Buchnera aphidicola]|uniref:superoxide dismutase n=1 Tax=Buchnera aphidicola TaxID=9 RepID=UPI0031B88518
MSYILPKLQYKYDALEPYIDKETMKIHHTKHHQKYVDNANFLLKDTNFSKCSENYILINLKKIPFSIRDSVRNNVGGHVNHSFFWKQFELGKSEISIELKISINKIFGSLEEFKKKFTEISISKFGSGWVWLVLNKNKLCIVSTSNQDNPLMGKNIAGVSGIPIIGLDLWEHAYYLKYKNNRIDYVNAFWNIINWSKISSFFIKSI